VRALPLAGRRILVTRATHQAGKLSEGLHALGAEPVEVPVLEIQPPVSLAPLSAALGKLSSYQWLILTSVNAVQALAERAGQLIQPDSLKVAAVGTATAAAARKAGLRVDFIPESYVGESLVAGLLASSTNRVAGQRILLARAETARDVIPDALRQARAEVDIVDAYRNAMPKAAPQMLREAVARGLDAATFTSSSSATHLQDAVRIAGIEWPLSGVAAVSIGPVTSGTLEELGWPPAAEADPHDVPGLIAAVQAVFAGR
jgi:uroporphyrinogen-III synthase